MQIPGAFGGGDIKLMAVSEHFLGTGSGSVRHVFRAADREGAYGAFMLKSKKLRKKKMYLRFGPFLAFGLAGLRHYMETRCVTWYLHFL
ncbi:MAG: hypothetical protein ACLSGB_08220 [Dorea sp.]